MSWATNYNVIMRNKVHALQYRTETCSCMLQDQAAIPQMHYTYYFGYFYSKWDQSLTLFSIWCKLLSCWQFESGQGIVVIILVDPNSSSNKFKYSHLEVGTKCVESAEADAKPHAKATRSWLKTSLGYKCKVLDKYIQHFISIIQYCCSVSRTHYLGAGVVNFHLSIK